METLIGIGIKLVTSLLDRGEKPSATEAAMLAAAMLRDEATAIIFAQVLGQMHSEAVKVRAAFDAKPGEVPVLDFEVEFEKPEGR